MIRLSSKLQYEDNGQFLPISPFMQLLVDIESCSIDATKAIDAKLYSAQLCYLDSDEALKIISQLSSMNDEAFKLFCKLHNQAKSDAQGQI